MRNLTKRQCMLCTQAHKSCFSERLLKLHSNSLVGIACLAGMQVPSSSTLPLKMVFHTDQVGHGGWTAFSNTTVSNGFVQQQMLSQNWPEPCLSFFLPNFLSIGLQSTSASRPVSFCLDEVQLLPPSLMNGGLLSPLEQVMTTPCLLPCCAQLCMYLRMEQRKLLCIWQAAGCQVQLWRFSLCYLVLLNFAFWAAHDHQAY